MNARKVEQASLVRVQEQIDRLRDDLDWTLRSVDILTRNGQHETALELVEAQRRELELVVDGVARDAGADEQRAIKPSWRAALVAIAAVLVLFGIGVAVIDHAATTSEIVTRSPSATEQKAIERSGDLAADRNATSTRVRTATAARVADLDDSTSPGRKGSRSGLNHLAAPQEDHTPALELPSPDTDRSVASAGTMLARS